MVTAVAMSAACSIKPLASDAQSPSQTNAALPSPMTSAGPTVAPPSATMSPTPTARVATALPADLVVAMERGGAHIAPPDGSVPVTNADIAAAIATARHEFGPEGTAVAFAATVTVEGYHTGDENSPLVIEDRQLILVQITGLHMPPIGPPYGDPPPGPDDYSYELDVMVDAKTGEYLLASSTR